MMPRILLGCSCPAIGPFAGAAVLAGGGAVLASDCRPSPGELGLEASGWSGEELCWGVGASGKAGSLEYEATVSEEFLCSGSGMQFKSELWDCAMFCAVHKAAVRNKYRNARCVRFKSASTPVRMIYSVFRSQ